MLGVVIIAAVGGGVARTVGGTVTGAVAVVGVAQGLLERAEADAAEHVEQVDGADDHAGAGGEGEERPEVATGGTGEGTEVAAGLEGAEHAEELADEAVGAGQADGGHGEQDEEGGPDGHLDGQAAELGHVAGVVALVHHADAQEERAGGQAVVDHVEHGALQAGGVEGEHAQHAEAQVGD